MRIIIHLMPIIQLIAHNFFYLFMILISFLSFFLFFLIFRPHIRIRSGQQDSTYEVAGQQAHTQNEAAGQQAHTQDKQKREV